MALNLSSTVLSLLKSQPESRLTARQIAEKVFQNHPSECRAKKEKSIRIETDDELVQQIAAEIAAQRPNMQRRYPQIKTTEGRPRKYYYTDKSEEAEVKSAEIGTVKANKMAESDLYMLLSEYVWVEHGIYSKRIDEKRSSNRNGPGGNKWLFPDLVGMEDLSSDWNREVKDCVAEYSDKRTKLWSFEVKLLLNRSNVRECYFQAVSNSSWGNFGYLVAAEIEGSETMRELRMLSAVHGIGLIRLDVENPAESQILIPARERVGIDWDSVNRLAVENRDFEAYIKLLRQFYQTGDPRPNDWDFQESEEER